MARLKLAQRPLPPQAKPEQLEKPGLQSLNISYCHRITQQGLKVSRAVIYCFASHLYLYGCSSWSSIVLHLL